MRYFLRCLACAQAKTYSKDSTKYVAGGNSDEDDTDEGDDDRYFDGEDDSDVSDDDEEDDDEPTVCLFIPAGWWHWILADSEWHVAWSGSFFPPQSNGSREASRRASVASCAKSPHERKKSVVRIGQEKNEHRGKSQHSYKNR